MIFSNYSSFLPMKRFIVSSMSFIVEELEQQQAHSNIPSTGGVLTGLLIEMNMIIIQQHKQEIFDPSCPIDITEPLPSKSTTGLGTILLYVNKNYYEVS
jgi:hypothetical protein